MKKSAISKFIREMKKEKFLRKQEVYEEGSEVNCMYIVYKGEFE